MRLWLVDTVERAISTAVQTFLATWVITDTSSGRTAAVAAVAAGLSVAKGSIAARYPSPVSPASTVTR